MNKVIYTPEAQLRCVNSTSYISLESGVPTDVIHLLYTVQKRTSDNTGQSLAEKYHVMEVTLSAPEG